MPETAANAPGAKRAGDNAVVSRAAAKTMGTVSSELTMTMVGSVVIGKLERNNASRMAAAMTC